MWWNVHWIMPWCKTFECESQDGNHEDEASIIILDSNPRYLIISLTHFLLVFQKWAVDYNSAACESLKLNHPETNVVNLKKHIMMTLFFFIMPSYIRYLNSSTGKK